MDFKKIDIASYLVHVFSNIFNDKLLKKYKQIWDEISCNIVEELDSEPIDSNSYVKAKEKSCNGFHDSEMF